MQLFHWTRCVPSKMLDNWKGVEHKAAVKTSAESNDPTWMLKKAGDVVTTEDGMKYFVEVNFVGAYKILAVHGYKNEVVLVDTSGLRQRGIERCCTCFA